MMWCSLPRTSARPRMEHDDALANGGVNSWAKYAMGLTSAKAGVVRPSSVNEDGKAELKGPTATSFATEEDRNEAIARKGVEILGVGL